MTPEEIDRGVAGIIEVIDDAAKIWPQIMLWRPLVAAFIRYEAHKLKAELADGTVVPDGAGGFVTKEWADDPRHALNRDGTFKF